MYHARDVGRTLTPIQQLLHRLCQHRIEPHMLQVAPGQSKDIQGRGAGTDQQTVFAHRQQPFRHGAQPLGLRVQPKLQPAPVAQVVPRLEQPVLDHPRRRAHQTEGMSVIAPVVSGHIERAQHTPIGRVDRRRRTGQKTISLEKVLIRMDHHRPVIGQCRADRIGAPVLFMPGGPRPQRHPFGPADKMRITRGMQQHAVRACEYHHAVGFTGLVKQELHHGSRMGHQFTLHFQRPSKLGARGVGSAWRAAARLQTRAPASHPGLRELWKDEIGRQVSTAHQLAACLP